MAESTIFHIELRYNGHFKQIKRKKRIIYEGGRMRTLTVDYDKTCHMDFVEECKELLKWDDMTTYQLLYAIPNSKPLMYTFINNERDYMEMLQSHMKKKKCTLYVAWEMKRLPIRRMYNHVVLESKIRHPDYNVELPHFIFEDEEWLKLLFPDGRNVEVVDEGSEMEKVDSNLKDSKQSQGSTGDGNQEAGIGDSYTTPKKPKTVEGIVELPRRSPRFTKVSKDTSKSTQQPVLMEYIEHGDEVEIENEDNAEDEMEDCFSQDTYHSLHSSHEGSSSGDDDSADEGVSAYDGRKSDVNLDKPQFQVGQTFDDKNQLRLALRQHAVINNFELKFVKNDNVRCVVKCAGEDCSWRLRAYTWRTDSTTMEIRTMNEQHTCTGVNRCGTSQATSRWIADKIKEKVKVNRDLTPKSIAETLFNDFGLTNLPYKRMWRARDIARDLVFGNVDEDYKYLPSLRAELLSKNPGSHIEFSLDAHYCFERIFVSFRALLEGLKGVADLSWAWTAAI